jgi:hypothetical protein
LLPDPPHGQAGKSDHAVVRSTSLPEAQRDGAWQGMGWRLDSKFEETTKGFPFEKEAGFAVEALFLSNEKVSRWPMKQSAQ